MLCMASFRRNSGTLSGLATHRNFAREKALPCGTRQG